MNNDIVISVKDVHKKFKVYYDKGSSLKERILFKNRNSHDIRWVLKGISFDVRRGEAVGLIGVNGCGKSTTLKMLTRIMYPDKGTIEVKGRVSSLLELGAGFHPDMSGRENIYTNASIFGLSKTEIDSRIQSIIDFSELEEYIDNPVRTYSSGMYMRLAFSVAINVDADVLLIDEILAVGDARFQAKCFNKIMEIKEKGTTFVIVSHSLGQIEQICDRTIWIDDGVVRESGSPKEVHEKYSQYMNGESEKEKKALAKPQGYTLPTISEKATRFGDQSIKFVNVKMTDKAGNEKLVYNTRDIINIKMGYKLTGPAKKVNFGFSIHKSDGTVGFGTNTDIEYKTFPMVSSDGDVKVKLDNRLMPGIYYLNVAAYSEDNKPFDDWQQCLIFEVQNTSGEIGQYALDTAWTVCGKELKKQ